MDYNVDVDDIISLDKVDVYDIKSLKNAVNDLKHYFNFYNDYNKFINTDRYMLVKDINELLKPYSTLYNNEEYNPFKSLVRVLKSIDGQDLSVLTNKFVYEFSVAFINAVLMKANYLLAEKELEKATPMGDDYLSQLLNLFNDKKSMSELVTFYDNKVKTSESELQTITDHIEKSASITYITADDTPYDTADVTADVTADETTPEFNEDVLIKQHRIEPRMLQLPRPAPAPRPASSPRPAPALRPAPSPRKRYKTSYLPSFLQSMTRKGKKKGGMATRKKKYRRRYKKQIKRRTKKTRSTH